MSCCTLSVGVCVGVHCVCDVQCDGIGRYGIFCPLSVLRVEAVCLAIPFLLILREEMI